MHTCVCVQWDILPAVSNDPLLNFSFNFIFSTNFRVPLLGFQIVIQLYVSLALHPPSSFPCINESSSHQANHGSHSRNAFSDPGFIKCMGLTDHSLKLVQRREFASPNNIGWATLRITSEGAYHPRATFRWDHNVLAAGDLPYVLLSLLWQLRVHKEWRCWLEWGHVMSHYLCHNPQLLAI